MHDTTETTAPAAPQQGTHQYLLTLQVPMGGGFAVGSWTGTWTPHPGTTRHDLYLALRDDIARKNPEYGDASVLFFDVQSNQI
ncbi:hypothetical protein [Streptomyces sp. NPDC008137]|uniref:hypothetical protein n=1 Tax=Streptomyces sp. NPDC008137 TaxID=3364813 RepID=UPI0036EDE6F3